MSKSFTNYDSKIHKIPPLNADFTSLLSYSLPRYDKGGRHEKDPISLWILTVSL